MYLTQVVCDGFRGLRAIDLAPSRGITIIRGGNAQGKTSILEAILYAATSKSHRASQEAELVRHAGEGFHIELKAIGADKRPLTIAANWWKGAKRFKVNGVSLERVSDILGKINVVLFSPEDVSLVKGSAAVRRRFLDMEISQLNAHYLHALQQYRVVLRQRNELLRQTPVDLDVMDAWDEQLVRHGTVIMEERRLYCEELSQLAMASYERIVQHEPLALAYEPDIPDVGAYTTTLVKNRPIDIKRGTTHRGPHRDDFNLDIGGVNARAYASQGQQKSATLAMKLAEVELIKHRTRDYPVLMLDEVIAELDASRARQLFEAIPEPVQCLVTTTDLSGTLLPQHLEAVFYEINGGQLVSS